MRRRVLKKEKYITPYIKLPTKISDLSLTACQIEPLPHLMTRIRKPK